MGPVGPGDQLFPTFHPPRNPGLGPLGPPWAHGASLLAHVGAAAWPKAYCITRGGLHRKEMADSGPVLHHRLGVCLEQCSEGTGASTDKYSLLRWKVAWISRPAHNPKRRSAWDPPPGPPGPIGPNGHPWGPKYGPMGPFLGSWARDLGPGAQIMGPIFGPDGGPKFGIPFGTLYCLRGTLCALRGPPVYSQRAPLYILKVPPCMFS